MVYQRVSKSSSGNSQIHKKDSASAAQMTPVPTQLDSASPQEQEMPTYTPLPANWVNNHNLIKNLSGAEVVQRQEELGEEETEPIQAKLTMGAISAKDEGSVLHRSYELNEEKDVTVTQDHRAKEVYVKNIKGEPLGPAANSPTVEPFGWKALWNEGHTLGSKSSTSSHYNAVRMHLWNGRLGGPGNETWNLAPGPAKVNSMMSAGPEMAAKNLVAAGYSVWLRTKVEYINHSNNANDFTSVVPNKIVMEWGVMGKPSSNASWNCDIELPVAPLQGSAAQEYKDWDQNKPDDLVTKLASKTEQVRAQAYDLVQHDTLKFAILKNYPGTYLSMAAAAKGEVLKKFTASDSLWDFLTTDLKISSPETLVIEALLPLVEASAADRVQFLFGKFDSPTQRQMLIRYHDELLPHLGVIGINWSKSDYLIFTYNSDTKKANLLDLMSLNEMQTLLGVRSGTERKSVFNVWAQEKGYVNPQEKSDFINSLATVPSAWKTAYANQMALESQALEYLKKRPSRTKKPIIKTVVSLNKPSSGKVKKHSKKTRKKTSK